MSSPHSRFAVLVAASALVISAAAPAFAAGDAEARSAAISACKAAVAEQLSTDVSLVRLDKIQTRGRTVELSLEVRQDGKKVAAADCTYNRRAATTEVVVTEQATQTAAN